MVKEADSLFDDPEGADDDEVEIVEESDFDKKLDLIIGLLRKNEQEHQKIRDELKEIKRDVNLLQTAYQQHGKLLGELVSSVNGHFGAKL